MPINNYYVGDLNAIGAQMGQDRALSSNERIAMAQTLSNAIQQMGQQRSRNQESAAARAEQRYATDSDARLRRELALATLGQSSAARAETVRQFDATQKASGAQAITDAQLKRDGFQNLKDIADAQAKEAAARYGGFPPQAIGPLVREKGEVDQWNKTAIGAAANLNDALDRFDVAEKLEQSNYWFPWRANNAEDRATSKRKTDEAALQQIIDQSSDYVLPFADPAKGGRRRFKPNLRNEIQLPDFGPAPAPTAAATPSPSAGMGGVVDPALAAIAAQLAQQGLAGPQMAPPPVVAGPPPQVSAPIQNIAEMFQNFERSKASPQPVNAFQAMTADDISKLSTLGQVPAGTVKRSLQTGISYRFTGAAWEPLSQ